MLLVICTTSWRRSAISASPLPPATMPSRVKARLAGNGGVPAETCNYVAIVTGWTADESASHSPPGAADATIPRVFCARLATLVLTPKEEARRIASHLSAFSTYATCLPVLKSKDIHAASGDRDRSSNGGRRSMSRGPGVGARLVHVRIAAHKRRASRAPARRSHPVMRPRPGHCMLSSLGKCPLVRDQDAHFPARSS